MNRIFLIKPLLMITFLALSLNIPKVVWAQADDQTVNEPDQIVVTGSNIRRHGDYENPNPVQTIGEVEIQNTGAVRVQDIFKGLTVNSGSQTANRQNALQGVSQFSLRGLGIGSTLTLINGRRAGLSPVSDSSGAFFTDANAYPVNMIDRVEVLTDGASANYGSEAVAGVVNIITRKNFDGFEFGAEFRDSTHKSFNLSSAFGKALDRGHFSTFVNYYSQDGNFRGDIDIIRKADAANADGIGAVFSSGTAAPDRIDRAQEVSGSWERVPDNLPTVDNSINDNCVDPSRGSTNCRYPFINQRRIIAEEDRFQIFSQFDYALSSRLNIDSEFSFSRNEIRDGIGGAVLRNTVYDGGFLVEADNPYNYVVEDTPGGTIRLATAAEMAAINAGDAGALDTVDVIVRQRPLGARFDGENADDIETIFNNLRFSMGADYELTNRWLLHANYTYTDNSYTRSQPRDYSATLYQQAITDGRWNPFATSILDPNGIAKDGSTTFGNSAADLALFALTSNNKGSISQEVAEAIVSGETGFKLQGGDVAVALGTQYREITFENTPDSRIQEGTDGRRTKVEAIPSTKQDVVAVFAEVNLPVFDNLEMQIASRFEDYGDSIGSTFDPKFSLKYDMNDAIAFRGSMGTSFQAPSIQQQFGATGSAGIADPGNGELFNVDVIVAGSDDLTPQEATNFNLGAIFQTDNGIQISIDYWNYEYEELIGPRGGDPEAIVNAIYNANLNQIAGGNTPTLMHMMMAADMGSHPSLPGLSYTRDGSSSINNAGTAVDFAQLDSVSSEFTNLGKVEARGFDIAAAYVLPSLANLGEITLSATSTFITEFSSDTFSGIDGNGDLKGSRNFNNALGSTPDFKINGGVTWHKNNHTANVTIRYIDEYTDDQSRLPIDSQTTVDLRYSLLMPEFFYEGDAVFNIGFVNVFDEDAPRIKDRPLFDTEVHDVRGRQFYASFNYRFN